MASKRLFKLQLLFCCKYDCNKLYSLLSILDSLSIHEVVWQIMARDYKRLVSFIL